MEDVSRFQVNVLPPKSLSVERFWEDEKPPPTSLQISSNLTISDVRRASADSLELDYLFTVNYTPGLATIHMRGKAKVTGEKTDIGEIFEMHSKKKPIPPNVVQPILNLCTVRSVIFTHLLGLPPPMPMPSLQPGAATKPEREPTYIK